MHIQRRIQFQEEFWKVVRRQEFTLRQKARSNWLLEGDRNSKYFYSLINWRKRKNVVRGLVIDGVWCEDPSRVKPEVRNYFLNFWDLSKCLLILKVVNLFIEL